jgi:cytochrome c-type biogenesis protein CcsB
MPSSYTQYNTNAAALMDAHVAAYMSWYEAAVVLYLIAALVFAGYWFTRSWTPLGAGIVLASLGIVAQTISLGLRWHYSQHVPWNDLYGSLSVVSLFTAVLFLIFGARYRIWFAAPLVFLFSTALLAYAKGWNKGLEPLVPSLQSSWIYIHVPVVLASYAAFLIGCVISILYLFKKADEDRMSRSVGSVGAAVATPTGALAGTRPRWLAWLEVLPASAKLDVAAYRVNSIGLILLTAGIILGALWAHVSWGSYWQWDPKETAALTNWIVYAAYVHLHTKPSMRGKVTAWVSIFGFLTVLFSYFAVNIVISGLHSYK